MIKTEKLVPEVYYDRSRDFQLLGRICEFLFNYLKTGTNAIENTIFSDTFDLSLIDLMTSTLGFRKAHEYDAQQLLAFCSAFPYLLRNKGNIKSIECILTLISNVQNIAEPIMVNVNDGVLEVFVSEKISDLALFEDVLDYILPAGISCRIINASLITSTKTEEYKLVDTLRHTEYAQDRTKAQVMDLWNPSESRTPASINEKPLPTPSDSKESRIDNSTIIRWDLPQESED